MATIIIIPLFLVLVIALLFVIVLMFVRYRRKGLYNKFDNNQFQYNHDDDSVHYQQSPGGMYQGLFHAFKALLIWAHLARRLV